MPLMSDKCVFLSPLSLALADNLLRLSDLRRNVRFSIILSKKKHEHVPLQSPFLFAVPTASFNTSARAEV